MELKAMVCPMCGGSVITNQDPVTCNYCRTEFFPLVDKTGDLVVSLYEPVLSTACTTSAADWVENQFKEGW